MEERSTTIMGKSFSQHHRFFHNTMEGVIILGIIYKYTNTINNKSYIGQTIQSLEKRHKRHLQDSKNDNLYFHRALKKYGAENFSLEIIEDNVPEDLLDEREKYWIKLYNTFYLNDEGYNMTEGGQWGNAPRKLSDKDITEIKELLINTSIQLIEIAKEFNVSLSCISDINTGRTWNDEFREYPLRYSKITHTLISPTQFQEVINLLKTTELSFQEIGSKLDIKEYTVGSINRGEYSLCKTNLQDYPIRKTKIQGMYNNKCNADVVISIIYDLIHSSTSIKDLSNKYSLHYNSIGDINRGKTWKYITSQFKLPIRKNKVENEKLYGIVYSQINTEKSGV